MRVTLTSEHAKTFRAVLSASLDRYGMKTADLVDHDCRVEPNAKERENLAEFGGYVMGSLRCPCKELSLGGSRAMRRKRMRVIVQNARNEKRPLSHARAYALYLLLINSKKAVAWRRTHPEVRDPAIEPLFSPPPLGFTLPPGLGERTPPKQYPEVGLTPRGVVALADVLTEALREKKLIRGAKDDTRDCIVATLRGMYNECNHALVARLRLAAGRRRVHVMVKEEPIKSELVRRNTGITLLTRRAIVVRDCDTPPPDDATEPDRWQHLQAMLWDQWRTFGNIASDAGPDSITTARQ